MANRKWIFRQFSWCIGIIDFWYFIRNTRNTFAPYLEPGKLFIYGDFPRALGGF